MDADAALQDAVTTVLQDAEETGSDPVDRLVPLVHDRLRTMAHAQLRRERDGRTLSTTELVREAYLSLADPARLSERGRTYFIGAAARAMRQILVGYARRRQRAERRGRRPPFAFDADPFGEDSFTEDQDAAADGLAADLVDLDAALDGLAALSPRQARVVECRFFGGLSVEETADVLGVSPRTVQGDWALAEAWLFRALDGRTSR